MKTFFLILPCLLGWWFYRPDTPKDAPSPRAVTANQPAAVWPDSLPVFGELDSRGMALVRSSDNAAFVSFLDPAPPPQVLARATAAFTAQGWQPAPVGTSDMLLFTRGEDVAAVLAETIDAGTRVSAIQRLAKGG